MHIVLNQSIFVTMTFNNTTNAASIFSKGGLSKQVATNISNNDSGTLHLEYFEDSNTDFDYQLTQARAGSSYTQEFKEQAPDDSSTDITLQPNYKDDSTHSNVVNGKSNDSKVSTPGPKRTLFSNSGEPAPIITPLLKEYLVPDLNNGFAKAISSASDKHPPKKAFSKIYSSPFLEKEYKPLATAINLAPELELLKPLIMSQHEVFTQSIIELGNTNLYLSDIIEKKKESLKQIKYNNKIPRSLRIKCGLTTSPAYSNNNDFLRLKDELQEAVNCFIKTGTKVMTEWAELNTQLLIKDRCTSILEKALTILDGLSSFFTEVIGTPHFPSLPSYKYINLFLWKIYLSNLYIEVDNLVEFFELPLSYILTLGAKLIAKTESDDEADSMIRALNLDDIDTCNPTHEQFISETLISFDQILKVTTIDTWTFHKERNKHNTAAQNLKAKMISIQTSSATEATAQAIAKATENINSMNAKDLNSNLRITNLEKEIRKQDQKLNETMKNLPIYKEKQQKNFNGSYSKGSIASPESQTLQLIANKKRKNQQKIIDLSNEDMENDSHRQQIATAYTPSPYYKQNQRRQRKTGNLLQHPSKKGKTVHWKDDNRNRTGETHTPPGTTFAVNPQQLQTTLLHNSFHGGPPAFPPAPSPFNQQQLNPFQNAPATNNGFLIPGYTFQQTPTLWRANLNSSPFHASTTIPPPQNPMKNNPFGTGSF